LSPADTPHPTTPLVVVDNNVVLDWLLFQNPDGLALGAAIDAGRVRWLGTAGMREELGHVLASGRLARWAPDRAQVLSVVARLCHELPAAPSAPPALRLRCTDPDDQIFIDLAVASRATWLLTRDRAVLKLARRMHGCGVEVLTPTSWVAAQAAS
jgi:putative PIN family toxin of toxin-antitoxin system